MDPEKRLVFTNYPAVQALPGIQILEEYNGWSSPRSIARFCDDPDQTGRTVPKIPEKIRQTRFLLRTDNTWFLNGHRWLINAAQDTFFSDVAVNDENVISNLLSTDRDTGLVQLDRETFNFRPRARKCVRIEGEVGLAVSAEPSNWGSFLFRVVPKLAWLRVRGVSQVLMYRQYQQQIDLAEILGFSDLKVHAHFPNCDYEMQSALMPSQCHTNGALDIFAREVFLGLGRKFEGMSKFGKKIYISRGSGIATASGRKCINEADVCAALMARGFEIVIPDKLSIGEQIATFANAEFVIGPAGAGMFNSVFCRPGTKLIDIESERHWIYAHCNLFSSLGLDFGVFWGNAVVITDGPQTVHRPFSVNVAALVARVSEMEATKF